MRSLLIALTVALIIAPFACGNAVAADQVSNEMLTQMGLSSMQTLSDAQGEQIRGKCFLPPLVSPLVLNLHVTRNSPCADVNFAQGIDMGGCCGGVTVNGVLVNNSAYATVVTQQTITRNAGWCGGGCCSGIALNGIVVTNSMGASVIGMQSINF